jgi:hypothetical protein
MKKHSPASVVVRGTVFAALVALAALTPPKRADAAPPCTGRYTANAAGTVTDNDTHLEWQQTTDDVARFWNDAKPYCEGLPLDGGGWRLPTSVELQTLFDDTLSSAPHVDTSVFFDDHLLLWSSTEYAADTGSAWAIDFEVSGAGTYTLPSLKAFSANRVRCVR